MCSWDDFDSPALCIAVADSGIYEEESVQKCKKEDKVIRF